MFQARQSEEIIEESFAGSLPDFVAAFTSRKKLSKKELCIPAHALLKPRLMLSAKKRYDRSAGGIK